MTFDVASIRHIENTEQIRSELRAGTRRPGMLITDTRVSITYLRRQTNPSTPPI
jgi:hypothetical protein